ncbi:MAG: glycosyltransferase [Actinobacteria bacterium]|nr:MAG: glycosyltransferase [Actinomycetota bacterium]
MKVLMLTPLMKMGYGVPEAIASLARGMAPLGIETVVGCMDSDDSFGDLTIRHVNPHPPLVLDLAAQEGAIVVVANGSPYFEVLPALTGKVRTIAYEYGDPTPEMFAADAAERRAIVEHKRSAVYPNVDAVAVISEFIRHDIGWPQSHVVVLGVDHIPDLGPKPARRRPAEAVDREPLRVGTLMRLGEGEARYKGTDLLPALREAIADGLGDDAEVRFEVMGRGTPEDAARLRAAGFTVHLNATDVERAAYLRELDVFVTPSKWEGMNLPLVEAQALGTPGLAFDTGAHPEFTPLLFRSVADVALQVAAYSDDRDGLLAEHGRAARAFVRDRLRWQDSAERMARLIRDQAPSTAPRRRRLPARLADQARRGLLSVRHHGLRETWRRNSAKLRRTG